MAYEIALVPDVSFKNTGDLSAKQYFFVKLSANDTVVICAAATDVPVGVLQNKPTANQGAVVRVFGISKVSADATLTFGTLIGTSGDGQADAKTVGSDTTEYVVGQITKGASAANGLASAMINCMNPHRAA
jgi:hypothetical protein